MSCPFLQIPYLHLSGAYGNIHVAFDEERMKLLQVPMPDHLVERFGGEAKAAAHISRAAVIELLRAGEMTSGEAAEALNLSRRQILEIMAERDIPIANYSPSELEDELRALQQIAP
jgi:predicted HTH domain antitoxin